MQCPDVLFFVVKSAIFREIYYLRRRYRHFGRGPSAAMVHTMKTEGMKYRILLVDDEPDILEFVGYNLQKAGYEVHTAENGAEAIVVAERVRPHLILLDRMMPVMDGVETCRAIRRNPELCNTVVVFLSALGEEEQQISGFEIGADDYLVKPIRMQLLISRVQAILKRVPITATSAEPVPSQGIVIDRESYRVVCDGHEIVLPRKEFALLDLLCSSHGKLISREEIYTKIWGTDVVVGDRTIDVHIRKLRQKIGESRITTVKGVGYKYVGTVDEKSLG